jgi:glutathione peroxidase
VDVNGRSAHPLYEHLKGAARGLFGSRSVKWNFTKFLVNRAGTGVTRYGTTTKPKDLASAIEKLLAEPVPA